MLTVVTGTQDSTLIFLPAVALPRRDGGEPVAIVNSWQSYLVEMAYHLRQVVTDDPDTLGVLTRSPRGASWLRPPVGDLVLVEDFLASMQRYGFSDEDAAAIYLAFFTRLLGLLHVQTTGSVPASDAPEAEQGAYPTLTRLRPMLSRNRDKDNFEDALDDILTSLERDLKR